MRLVNTSPKETIIRIEEEEKGGAVTVMLPEGTKTGRILSFTVPEGKIAGQTAEKLLSVVEKAAFDSGAVFMEADYPGYGQEESKLLEKLGYEITEGPPLVAVDIDKLLASKCVKKSLQCSRDEAKYTSFAEMDIYQIMKVGAFLSFMQIDEEFADPGFYSMEYSGAVFDGSDAIRAVILSTEVNDGIRVDLLIGRTNRDANYILSAVKGMVLNLADAEDRSQLKRIYVVEANKNTGTLLSRVLGKGGTPDKLGMAMHAKKCLTDNFVDCDVEYRPVQEGDDKWRNEAENDIFQANLAWKMAWHRENN